MERPFKWDLCALLSFVYFFTIRPRSCYQIDRFNSLSLVGVSTLSLSGTVEFYLKKARRYIFFIVHVSIGSIDGCLRRACQSGGLALARRTQHLDRELNQLNFAISARVQLRTLSLDRLPIRYGDCGVLFSKFVSLRHSIVCCCFRLVVVKDKKVKKVVYVTKLS